MNQTGFCSSFTAAVKLVDIGMPVELPALPIERERALRFMTG